ncbi:MAG TPA: hypothetical protein VGH33_06210 [Isosphaeraceae bacterium]
MAAGRRQGTIGGIMFATVAAAIILAAPRYVEEPVFWIALIALPWLSVWITAPLGIRRNNWNPIDFGHHPFDPSGLEAPDEVAARFRCATADLEALGFVRRGCYRHNPASHGIVPYLGLFERPGTWEVAKLMINLTRLGPRTTLMFQTTFADGTEMVTSDATELPPWPRREGVLGMPFPEIGSTSTLLEIHRALAARHGGRPVREMPPADDRLLDYLRATVEKNRAWPLAIGFTERDEARGVFRPTWKAAFWNAWGRLWPVGAIRRAFRRRRAGQTLRELVLEGRLAEGGIRA